MKNWLSVFLVLLAAAGCSSVSMSPAFPERLATEYSPLSTNLGGYSFSPLVKAPLRALVIAKVMLPRQEAFDLMLRDIHKWFPDVEEFTWSNLRDGEIVAGSVRTGVFRGETMVEPVLHINKGHYYVYKIDLERTTKFIPISNHLGVFTVEELSKTSSLVIWRQYFNDRIPFSGPLISWIMEDRIAEKAFDKLVETYGGQRIDYN